MITECPELSRKYKVVDVFTAQPLLGNPVAVGGDCVTVLDGVLRA